MNFSVKHWEPKRKPVSVIRNKVKRWEITWNKMKRKGTPREVKVLKEIFRQLHKVCTKLVLCVKFLIDANVITTQCHYSSICAAYNQ